jgi:hypothetical protein
MMLRYSFKRPGKILSHLPSPDDERKKFGEKWKGAKNKNKIKRNKIKRKSE